MRNPVACIACRTSKRQCIYSHAPPCKRCKDRGEPCLFPAAGTSYLHRQRRTGRPEGETSASPTLLVHRDASSNSSRGGAEAAPQYLKPGDARSPSLDLSLYNPYDFFTDEVKNSFLRCSYKWSFYHIPTLLRRVRQRTVDEEVIWAVLALAIRFSKNAPAPFNTPLEASNAFAAHTKAMVLQQVEEATLSGIQVLLMITGHSWGAGEGHRAWMYLGMAVRMTQILGLFDESPVGTAGEHTNTNASHTSTQDAFLTAEERRRTAWTCFLMDSLLSGGKRRRRLLSADDMRIQLPCDSDDFHFADPVRCERLDRSVSDNRSLGPIVHLGIVAYSMRIADIWGKVARWACSSAVHGELPWEPNSEFQYLLKCLDQWRYSLPRRLEFSVLSLHAHSAANQGQAYCYMHSIYFMSIMFLHRSYLSHVETQNKHDSDSALDRRWRHWQLQSRRELLEVSDRVCDMYKEMREFGLGFLCGLVPWVGFTVYTAVGIMLYYHQFPETTDNSEIMCRAKDRIVYGCELLKDMRGSWPMADYWRETIKRMQIFYANIQSKGVHGVSHTERQAMQQAVVDYGALQPDSPSQEKNFAPPRPREYTTSSSQVVAEHRLPPSIQSTSSASTAPVPANSTLPVLSHTQQEVILSDVDVFDSNFAITDADMELLLENATQDFWAHFPGEVGMF